MDPFPPHPNLIIRARTATFILIRGTVAPPDLRHFEFASRGSADPALFAALQSAIHDHYMMSQVRSYFATWEHIDVSRMDDAAVVRILRDEIDRHALAAYRVTDEHFLPVWTSDPGPIPPPTGPVATWSTLQKLSAMFQAMPAAAGPVLGPEVSAFFSPENIALMAAFGEAIAAAQAVAGANAVVDALILGVGSAVFGWAGLCAAWDFAKAMIRAGGATSEDEIRLAARLAVAAFVSIGLVLFLHKLSGKLKRDDGSNDDAPPKTDTPRDKGRPRPQRPEDLPTFKGSGLQQEEAPTKALENPLGSSPEPASEPDSLVGDGKSFAGHGGIVANADGTLPTTIVPPGTSVTVFTGPNQGLYDSVGQLIESGDTLGGIELQNTLDAQSTSGAMTYLPGARIPNYMLFPGPDLNILQGSMTVDTPTPLSDLLQPNMGSVNWAACTTVMAR